MADFAAVLKKTLDGLGETTPAVRARVYDKARSTINTKLAALDPPPPQAVADRQRQALENAIRSVEGGFAASEPAADPLDELESVFSSIDAQRQSPPPLRPAAEKTVPPAPRSSAPPLSAPPRPAMPRATMPPAPQPAQPRAAEPRRRAPEPEPFEDPLAEEPTFERDGWDGETAALPAEEPRRRGKAGRLIAAVVVLAALGGGAYAAWTNKEDVTRFVATVTDSLSELTGGGSTTTAQAPAPQAPAQPQPEAPANAAAQPKQAAAPPAAEPAPAAPEPAQDVAAAQPPGNPARPETPAAPAQPPKFTQRLAADGTETDAGAGTGAGAIGEGTSVAEQTPPAPAAPGAAPAAAAIPPAASPPPAAGEPSVAVAQRAIFYEERTNVAPASAEAGSIVWSTVQESPGGDLPPEPAIRAEATIPGKDMQLRMTIRRNTDRTLPASHIIEIIFLTQGSGEAIDNVLRVSMKGSEQDPGSPLLGNAAKIADGYFLVALDDGTAPLQANLNLLRQQDWIDVPVVYKSGRRALFTMEKGIPGEKAFADALRAWQQGSG